MAQADVKAKRHAAALKAWDKRGRKADASAAVSRGDWNQNNTEAQHQLRTSPVTGIEPLGGGVSETYVVTLASGQKANFKVGGQPENEVAAWEVAQLVGMEDMVPPAAIRTIAVPGDDRRRKRTTSGSIALWQKGTPAVRVGAARKFDGPQDLQRAAMFDVIIGNLDRHEGNWVVDDNEKIRLIDHNLTFGRGVGSQFLVRIRKKMGDLSPAKFAAPYLAKKSQIATKLRAAGLAANVVAATLRRIDIAASAKTWDDLIRAEF